MNEEPHNPELERLQEFIALRKQVNLGTDAETEKRIQENPHPTDEEILIGAFREMIDPQVRDALFEFYHKGYNTECSGFCGKYGEIQSIDGYFEIDENTKRKIEALGGKILKGKDFGIPYQSEQYTYVTFKPTTASLKEMKKKWNEIANILPEKAELVQPSISGGGETFRKRFAPERTDIEKSMLQRRLAMTNQFSPEMQKEMQERLLGLSN
ncbi:MAG: hypothetical protein COU28_00280 [Candidatus Magasanikbacteria bacterium CG10_big_fil_rev_8_21_14_0_10_36_16]|uniref:Uncharacterized protein n=1 Tax=Candidatus Magasanikbacteria bacterium CG10_big_fil_rev_8_21_14_0_10_36_16 TaxID=1974645 RepID=A0A2H0TZK7_9BACT|nr:MAG: hypothetical protein COU28_00280 [Candidatus Magasanikbacteria bacterium CG10_big_fil_rev_8_21_14_0_10_36_16]